MRIESITLENFRNVEKATIEFSDGVNLLYGKNAQGKTNALEAIYYLAGLKSFRCPKYREMISYDASEAKIEGIILQDQRKIRLGAILPKNEKRTVLKNGVKPQKLSEYMGIFRAVLFCPEHLDLIKGGPAERRSFIDGAICQLKPAYASLLNEFNRIYGQRQALFRSMKDSSISEELLEVWDESYASLSLRISKTRKSYLQSISSLASEFYQGITNNKEELSLSYKCDVDPFLESAKDEFLNLLKQNREVEKRNLFCPKGSHKDDIICKINGKNSRFYASQGQQRSCVLSLKLAEGAYSTNVSGQSPVFLLDDVLSELDSERRDFILSHIQAGQVIITSCDPDGFKGLENIRKILVEKGSYKG